MILRALFWIAVVAVLMPHEPNLGLGSPSADASTGSLLSKLTNLIEPSAAACQNDPIACVTASHIAMNLPDFVSSDLANVKAQIEEARRERAARRHG